MPMPTLRHRGISRSGQRAPGHERLAIAVLLVLTVLLVLAVSWPWPRFGYAEALQTNEDFIRGLYADDIDLNDTLAVFRFVFAKLPRTITVYPTENYYYFRFISRGKTIGGSLSLFAHNRDRGILGFGYSEHAEDIGIPDPEARMGGGKEFGPEDGVAVRKIDDFTYRVTFEGKSVTVRLNDAGLEPPQRARLLPEEVFVGPVHDESGLQFHLLFNNATRRFQYLLNQDGFVPERFRTFTYGTIIGDRTGFVFHDDASLGRRLLIGVKGHNVVKNNWYDGPFDQLPDNRIATGEIDLQPYIEAAYPEVAGNIDRYGHYLDDPGTRVAIAPYFVYFTPEDLMFVDRCREEHPPATSGLFACLTRQVYEVPDITIPAIIT
jgi:hypothetical protein